MIEIGDKTYRNLQEQVAYNADKIEDHETRIDTLEAAIATSLYEYTITNGSESIVFKFLSRVYCNSLNTDNELTNDEIEALFNVIKSAFVVGANSFSPIVISDADTITEPECFISKNVDNTEYTILITNTTLSSANAQVKITKNGNTYTVTNATSYIYLAVRQI